MSPFVFAPRNLKVLRADGEGEEGGSILLSQWLLGYLSGAPGSGARSQHIGQISA